ncbi:MAG: Smr/MutS family protein [Bacteroidaceae bacterium]|nr:Smr/MutS family protein [Bacteroidaceae bacterium]
MFYPKNFEAKVGFTEIRTLLRGRCLSSMGADEVNRMTCGADVAEVNRQLATVREFRAIMDGDVDFPTQNFNDLRPELLRLQIKGTYLEEQDLFALRNTMETLGAIVEFMKVEEEGREKGMVKPQKTYQYPLLAKMADEVKVFPRLIIQVDSILNAFGKVKDDASPELARIRQSLVGARRSVSLSLRNVMSKAQECGYVEKDVAPTYRDGRLVIPVRPEMKRKIRGIVHDESATGKTVFIEPSEVVEANNRIRSLEAEEQRAIIMILQAMAEIIRPQIEDMLEAFVFLGKIDFIRAKAVLADKMDAVEPMLSPFPTMDWVMARHPLLETSLKKQGREIVPLDIQLQNTQRLLLISGPNAGGKSVCLKTVALLQYMMQCGVSVPMRENSKAGFFENIFIDIGDEQSIEDDLSTYSSHLSNMKNMMKLCSSRSLILIDEFGGGTEPQIGSAIAQAMLDVFLAKSTYGIITTHYQSLKHYANSHEGIVNAAMLYDRAEMRPLFVLQIGNPGSSFAIEIARSIGLPQQVIERATSIVGEEYIKSDKYLQDIVRDKRYWENKRLAVHQKERTLQQMIDSYEARVAGLDKERKALMEDAKSRAEELFNKSNAVIENTIRSIREAQAEKEETRRLRTELEDFKTQVLNSSPDNDDAINRKMEQIRRRRERREERRKMHATDQSTEAGLGSLESAEVSFAVGDFVKVKGSTAVGKIVKLKEKEAVVQAGMIKLNVTLDDLELSDAPKTTGTDTTVSFIGKATRESMHEKNVNFKADIDVRGMNGREALEAVTYFIEDAIQCGATRLSILHGTGTGYLRTVIRQYLRTVPTVASYHDEHVQFGGAGITIVEMDY